MEDVKDELKAYIYNKEFIDEQLDKIEERKTLIEKITAILSDMPKGTPDVTRLQKKIAELIDFTNDLEKTIEKWQEKQITIENKINEMEQPYALILYKMYIKGKNLVTVASEMNYNYDYMCRMHGIALKKYEETTCQ